MYMYICMYMYMCVYIYIFIYVYIRTISVIGVIIEVLGPYLLLWCLEPYFGAWNLWDLVV